MKFEDFPDKATENSHFPDWAKTSRQALPSSTGFAHAEPRPGKVRVLTVWAPGTTFKLVQVGHFHIFQGEVSEQKLELQLDLYSGKPGTSVASGWCEAYGQSNLQVDGPW